MLGYFFSFHYIKYRLNCSPKLVHLFTLPFLYFLPHVTLYLCKSHYFPSLVLRVSLSLTDQLLPSFTFPLTQHTHSFIFTLDPPLIHPALNIPYLVLFSILNSQILGLSSLPITPDPSLIHPALYFSCFSFAFVIFHAPLCYARILSPSSRPLPSLTRRTHSLTHTLTLDPSLPHPRSLPLYFLTAPSRKFRAQ